MKKIIPYIFILIILAGLLSPFAKVHAAGEICWGENAYGVWYKTSYSTKSECDSHNNPPQQITSWSVDPPITQPGTPKDKSVFNQKIDSMVCGFGTGLWLIGGRGTVGGCLVQATYWLFHGAAALILWLSAYIFNYVIFITLNSSLFKATFVSAAWKVVRDLSNIFFILVLLYIAFKVILGLGGSEVKKMITRVIIVALLINFSMFFTEVVIDVSNTLALIFYNRLTTTPHNYVGVANEPDIAGGLVKNFDPTTRLNDPKFYTDLQTTWIKDPNTGQDIPVKEDGLPPGTMIAIILISGAVMLIAAYAFFVSGFSFLGRLIELWVLIIFSPFAFISSTIPLLSGIEYIGWEAWFKRLLKTAFMASIFMFFLFFIFLLINQGLFSAFNPAPPGTGIDEASVPRTLLNICLPAALIIILLLKATEYAKKGSGKFGEMVMKGAKIAGGLALGAATGGTALAARVAIGGIGGSIAGAVARGADKMGLSRTASGLRDIKRVARSSSFDVRGTKLGGKAISAAGLKGVNTFGEAQKGGWEQTRKDKVEKRQKRADQLKVQEDEPLKQNLNRAEMDLQGVLNKVAKDFEEIDRKLKGAREKKADAALGSQAEIDASAEIKALMDRKAGLKDGTGAGAPRVAGGKNDGKTIKQMEQEVIPAAKVAIQTEDRARTGRYAKKIRGNWFTKLLPIDRGGAANREAAHKIIMETKLESKPNA